MVDKNANMEKPSDAWKAGKGGSGSSSGRTRSQAPIGTRENSRMNGRDLGPSV